MEFLGDIAENSGFPLEKWRKEKNKPEDMPLLVLQNDPQVRQSKS